MKTTLPRLLAALLAVALLAPLAAADEAETTGKVIDAFLKSCRENKQFDKEKVEAATKVVEALRADEYGRYEAISAGLSELYPEYKQALVALAKEETADALASLKKLSASDDPYLAADASYYLSRAHMLGDRFDEALPLLEQVTGAMKDKTVLAGEALYLRGVCEVRLLKRDQAAASFERFINEFPDAPERMKIGAFRLLEQLRQLKPDTIADVYERMDFVTRRLAQQRSGSQTQEQQDKVIDILAKLIKEAEEKECNCSGQGQGEGEQGKNGGGEGEGQGGDGSGTNDKTQGPVVKKVYRGPRSPWSQIRDKQRDPAYSAIKEKFPARYEKLIEQYYKSFDDE